MRVWLEKWSLKPQIFLKKSSYYYMHHVLLLERRSREKCLSVERKSAGGCSILSNAMIYQIYIEKYIYMCFIRMGFTIIINDEDEEGIQSPSYILKNGGAEGEIDEEKGLA